MYQIRLTNKDVYWISKEECIAAQVRLISGYEFVEIPRLGLTFNAFSISLVGSLAAFKDTVVRDAAFWFVDNRCFAFVKYKRYELIGERWKQLTTFPAALIPFLLSYEEYIK